MAGDNGDNGLSGGAGGLNLTPMQISFISLFTGLSLVNALEVILRDFYTFRKRSGLYFWSVLLCASGIIIHSVANLIKFYLPKLSPFISTSLIILGWTLMVPGEAFVLYARLGLLVRSRLVMRLVLYMIFGTFFLLGVPTMVMDLGASSSAAKRFLPVFNVYEKIQITGFTIQECIISGLYIFECRRLLINKMPSNDKLGGRPALSAEFRRVINHLIAVSVFVIILDFCQLGSEYANIYYIELTMKPAIYAYKLRFEFPILNRLKKVVRPQRPRQMAPANDVASVHTDDLSKHSMHDRTLDTENPDGARYFVYAGKAGQHGSEPSLHENRPDTDDSIVRKTEVQIVRTLRDAGVITTGDDSHASGSASGESSKNDSKDSGIDQEHDSERDAINALDFRYQNNGLAGRNPHDSQLTYPAPRLRRGISDQNNRHSHY